VGPAEKLNDNKSVSFEMTNGAKGINLLGSSSSYSKVGRSVNRFGAVGKCSTLVSPLQGCDATSLTPPSDFKPRFRWTVSVVAGGLSSIDALKT